MDLYINKYSYIAPGRIYPHIQCESDGLSSIYRALNIDYPKFFKMDGMSKLGFLAVELLMIKEERTFNPRADIALICFNSSSSLNTDRQYHKSIVLDSYYPRPSLFVYTLPNIVTGEIAIRNKITGETSFYIFPEYNPEQIVRTVRQTLDGKPGHTAITGWIEYSDNVHEALMMQVSNRQESSVDIPFSPEKAGELMQHLRSITINQ